MKVVVDQTAGGSQTTEDSDCVTITDANGVRWAIEPTQNGGLWITRAKDDITLTPCFGNAIVIK